MEITEERVREIVREEIERCRREESAKFKADLAMHVEEWADRPPFAWLDAKGADATTDD